MKIEVILTSILIGNYNKQIFERFFYLIKLLFYEYYYINN